VSRNRFYKEVSVAAVAGSALHRVLLDNRPVKTPGGAELTVPSDPLAQAIADEWRIQGPLIRPETMMLTKLANTAIDRVAPNPASTRDQLLAIARSDAVCYRADSPFALVRRQELIWDPLLAWVAERFGASLRLGTGLSFIEQDPSAVGALDTALTGRDALSLAGLYAAAALCGSLVIALALCERKLFPEEAFAAANLDRIFQAERWGWDDQARAKAAAERAELDQISRFLELSHGYR
jgi:chaperone required for assembly of F1-ATPase